MAAALEYPPVVYIPRRAVGARRPAGSVLAFPGGTTWHDGVESESNRVPCVVTTLHAVAPAPLHISSSIAAAPVRLTRRGVRLIAAASLLVAGALVAIAWLSAPSGASQVPAGVPATVVVHSGDSLWSIAQRVAPQGDPRATVARLERVNGLTDGAALQPGQVLRVR